MDQQQHDECIKLSEEILSRFALLPSDLRYRIAIHIFSTLFCEVEDRMQLLETLMMKSCFIAECNYVSDAKKFCEKEEVKHEQLMEDIQVLTKLIDVGSVIVRRRI